MSKELSIGSPIMYCIGRVCLNPPIKAGGLKTKKKESITYLFLWGVTAILSSLLTSYSEFILKINTVRPQKKNQSSAAKELIHLIPENQKLSLTMILHGSVSSTAFTTGVRQTPLLIFWLASSHIKLTTNLYVSV